MNRFIRTDRKLDRVIMILEELVQKRSSLTPVRNSEKALANLREIRRSMQRLNKSDPKSRKKFWQLSRRASSLAVRLARRISGS